MCARPRSEIEFFTGPFYARLVLTAIAVGAGIGAFCGVASAFVSSLVVLVAKRLRNARLGARGGAPYRDVLRARFELFFGIVGAVAGGASGALVSIWTWSAVAGVALPAVWTLLAVVVCIAQSFGPATIDPEP